MNEVPIIDLSKCNGCELCVEVCMCQKLLIVDNVVQIRTMTRCNQCMIWCTMCETVCPTGAIQCPFDVTIEE